jgi:hypothetical protein
VQVDWAADTLSGLREPAGDELFRVAEVDTNARATLDYGTGGYSPVHTYAEPATVPDPGEHGSWTRSPVWDDAPTDTWTRPARWTEPSERPEPRIPKGRWRSGQMLFRRRYNTAAVVTIAIVAAVLFLLAALPLGVGDHTAAGTAVSPPAPARTQLVTIEAESPDNTLSGSASVGAYPGASGGQLVRAIGDWGSAKGPGTLRFNKINVPRAGTYVLTFYFVNIKGMTTRSALIAAAGSEPQKVTVTTGNSTCCTARAVQIPLAKGSNSITFANPAGEAPAIDRISYTVPEQ